MLFTNALTYAVAFAAAIPAVVAEYEWNDQAKLYSIGQIPHVRKSSRAPKWMGRCGGNDVKVGDYACGLFGKNGKKGTGIYKCVEDPAHYEGAWLQFSEVCLWAGGGYGGQCVRNSRRKGKKFYPFVDGKKAVCVTTEQFKS